ncbi:MAG: serine/threonine-protein kinase [Rhodoglobus sp.]
MRPTSGLTFGGRYQLSSRVAIGGMGEVWQATDLIIGRTVAIKILKDEYLGDPGFLERFRAEARHAALVNHEGIANVFDYGEEDGSAFLVMELVPGEALSAIIERERVLPTDRVLDIVAQTASALQAAHAAGLVHRDIKPGNLLITPDGRVKITDFGIARIADQVPLTATGQVMGTVQYLSPEQASGHPASPSTDIYSLGIVAYEALAGRRPFTGESQVAIAMAQINETPPELPVTVAEPVRNLVYACLAKSPSERPASASHLARAAQSLRRGDVAAAAAAVPGILGSGSHAATVGPNYGQTTAATSVLPSRAPTNTATLAVEEQPKRSPWIWPLVALISVLAVILVVVLIAVLGTPEPAPTPSTSTPQQSSSAPPPPPVSSSTPTATNNVALDPSELVGRTQDAVLARLTELELKLDAQTGTVAPSADKVGLAYDVTPSGNVRKNEVIRVTFYAEIPAPSAPKPAVLIAPSLTEDAGTPFTITWPAFVGCPAGHDLSGYAFQFENGGFVAVTNPIDKSVTQVDVQIKADVASGTIMKMQYTAICTDFESLVSDPVLVTAN